jgi:hypothetical protein
MIRCFGESWTVCWPDVVTQAVDKPIPTQGLNCGNRPSAGYDPKDKQSFAVRVEPAQGAPKG